MAGGRVSPRPRDRRGLHRFRLRDHAADGARGDAAATETHFFCDPIGHLQVSGDYVESWQPHPMSENAPERARLIAAAVTGDLGGLACSASNLFVKGDLRSGSARPRRARTTPAWSPARKWQNESSCMRAILGLPVDTSLKTPGASAVIYGGVEALASSSTGGRGLRVPGTELRLFGKPGELPSSGAWAELARHAEVEVARQRAAQAAVCGEAAAGLTKPSQTSSADFATKSVNMKPSGWIW